MNITALPEMCILHVVLKKKILVMSKAEKDSLVNPFSEHTLCMHQLEVAHRL